MKKWRATQNRKASEVEDFSPPESPEVGISVVEDHVVLRRICMTRRLPAGAEAMRVREKIGKSLHWRVVAQQSYRKLVRLSCLM
ncbi:hypothetical protein F2P81_010487 [Scophthalmus maximus]|uniref:Uncharacterized protein n=1 Tax=Scophthalmus maximus TaxID=52904 RepID=A0A6A4SUH2_SCOMX|nr:hypothetical protein F2P81_010487 [Scophthalmus maximus]